MIQDDVISAIKRFEAGETDFDGTERMLRKLTGKTVDRDHLENYWRGESIEDFAEKLATPEIEDWAQITDERARSLIDEAMLNPGGAVFLRNAEALEKRFRKTSGFVVQLVFHDDIDNTEEILGRLKEDTVISL